MSREQICEIGRRLYDRGLIVGCQGNLSVRLGCGQFLCTPAGYCKGRLHSEDLCLVDSAGRVLEGGTERSSELLLHLEIYRQCPNAGAVVHSHPPFALAFAVTHRELPRGILAEFDMQYSEVPLVPYAPAGTAELAQSILPFVHTAHTLLLANHGVVSYGHDLEEAFRRTELLEHYCRVLILAERMGPLVPFDRT